MFIQKSWLPTIFWEEPGEGTSGGNPPATGEGEGESTTTGEGEGTGENTGESEGQGEGEGDPGSLLGNGEGEGSETPEPLTVEALQLPEGMEIDEKGMTSFLDLMNNNELSPAERAQQLIELQASVLETAAGAAMEAAQAEWVAQQKAWQDEAKSLAEFSGDVGLDEGLSVIKKGLEKAGATKATFDALTVTGAGNHPELIRIFYALTKSFVEQAPITGEPPKGKANLGDTLFPNSNMEP